jgi:hypothetical protein
VLPVLFPASPEAANSKPDKPSPGEVPGPSHDYWSKFACERLVQWSADGQAGLMTHDEAYNKLRDIHGDAVLSDNQEVARAIEQVLVVLATPGNQGPRTPSRDRHGCRP